MKYTSEMVIEKLKEYPILKKKLHLLSFEMEHMMQVSEDDVLQTMAQALSCPSSIEQSGSPNLDKVMDIALSYRDRAAALNCDVMKSIVREWNEMRNTIARIDFYLSLLTKDEEKLLRISYIDKCSWGEMEKVLEISRKTIIRKRNRAVEHLKELLNYTIGIVE